METLVNKALKGGEWLVKETDPSSVFIPENFSEEQRMIRDMCNQYLDTEVLPILERIDSLEPPFSPLVTSVSILVVYV